MCLRERKRERKRLGRPEENRKGSCVFAWVCVCVCVCVRKRERERARVRGKEGGEVATWLGRETQGYGSWPKWLRFPFHSILDLYWLFHLKFNFCCSNTTQLKG